MCGIVGYCGPASLVSERTIGRMLEAIEHRGPDDSGTWSTRLRDNGEHRVWFGSRRLAVQDLSPAGHQPMTDPASGTAIAFNGELYNFLELRSAMERRGKVFTSHCDTEVALQSWCAEGLSAVDHWRGMFGAALWDDAKQELWLIRDQWGIKPLYYWTGNGALAFSSEVRGLLASGLMPRALSRAGLEDYLRYGSVQDPVTLIDGVYALLPGHALRWSASGLDTFCWDGSLPRHTATEAFDLEETLRGIVRQQLISDVPVVVFLSGGIDSSIISLLARQEAGAAVNTLSLAFEEDAFSERDYARTVAAHIGTTHHEVLLRADESLAHAIEAIEHMDQPSVDGVNTYVVCKAARRLGFTVGLSGMGGDEFFGGYSTFRRTAGLSLLTRLLRTAPLQGRLAAALFGPALARRGPAGQKFLQYLQHSDFTDDPYFTQRTLFYAGQIAQLCADSGTESEHARQASHMRYLTLLDDALRVDPLNRISYLEARVYMGNTLLRDSDQMSMANSFELRVPFVDQVLAAALLNVSGRDKGFGTSSKFWLRRTFSQYLPDEVFTRHKMGFTLPFAVWLRETLRTEVERSLAGANTEVLDGAYSRRVWTDFLTGKVDWMRPWALYVLNCWIARHISSHGASIPKMVPAAVVCDRNS